MGPGEERKRGQADDDAEQAEGEKADEHPDQRDDRNRGKDDVKLVG